MPGFDSLPPRLRARRVRLRRRWLWSACVLGGCLGGLFRAPMTARAADPLPAEPSVAGGVDIAAPDRQQRLDRAVVYRYDPFRRLLVPTPKTEWKPGHVYHRYSERLGRHVWSIATADGRMEYALGPGSVHPARNFDLRVSEAERQRELEAREPELARRLAILGARPTAPGRSTRRPAPPAYSTSKPAGAGNGMATGGPASFIRAAMTGWWSATATGRRSSGRTRARGRFCPWNDEPPRSQCVPPT